MKKSKVIIPAMAMILFSTAASISGTVAWFTASRVFSTSISTFQVANIDGNLSATMAPIVGCDGVTQIGSTSQYEGISVPNTSFLVDGSFAHTGANAGHAYRLSRDSAGYKDYGAYDASGVATNTGWLYKTIDSNNYYIALQWSITFTYTFGAETQPVDLFFDVKNSAMTGGNQTEDGKTKNSQKGFRIAFYGGSKNIVWGDLADETVTFDNNTPTVTTDDVADSYTYVDSTTTLAKYTPVADATSATSGDFFNKASAETTLAVDETSSTASANDSRTNKIATLTKASGSATSASATIYCVAWYEGTDPNVVNEAALQTCSASMSFYCRTSYSGT